MSILKAGLAAGAMFIGAIAALLGFVLTLSALKTGAVTITYGETGQVIKETVTQAADSGRYWRLVATLGGLPILLGVVSFRWGRRTLKR